MRRKVFKCIGLSLGLQGLLWGDFCEICGLNHESGKCPKETLEFRLDEFDVADWDSDVEESFVREHELEAQRLRSVRNRHHCRTLKQELAVRTSDTGTLEVDPLNADRVYRVLLEKCDRLLTEVTTLCDLVQVLDMGQTCKVCKAAQEAERVRKAEEERKRKEEEQRRLAEEQQRLERERLEREEAERRRIAEEEQKRREEEARKPKGFTGKQIVDYAVQHGTPKTKMRANQMVRFKRIQPSTTYSNFNQLDPFFHDAFKSLEKENK